MYFGHVDAVANTMLFIGVFGIGYLLCVVMVKIIEAVKRWRRKK